MWITPQDASPRKKVDFSQRFADEPDDDATRQAIRTLEALREITPHFWRLTDDEELQKLFEELREAAMPQGSHEAPEEETEQPFDQDKFFNDIEEMRKQIPKRL